MLPPHHWDDDVHRTAIHTAFDIWFMAYDQRCGAQTGNWHRKLARLCDEAKHRKRTVEINRALAQLALEGDMVHI